jgi:peptidoglycan/LPS O-acetylase OafA/YrhL
LNSPQPASISEAARAQGLPPASAAASSPLLQPPAAKIRIEGLDVLRLYAALGVVLFHYAFRGAAAEGFTRVSLPALAPIAKYGYLGVDCFFVISGFVIAWSAEGRTWRQFSVARFARIYPAFVVCMTATFAASLLFGGPRFETSLSQWAANLLVISPAVGVPFMDGAYWSIAYEIVFYGWMALFIAGGMFPGRATLLLAAWLALSMLNEVALGSIAVRRVFLTDHSGFFAAGVLLYLLRKGGRGALEWMLLGAGSLVAVFQAFFVAERMNICYKAALNDAVLAICALGAIAIVAAASGVRDLKVRAGVVAAIGGLTYPLYLLHQHAGYVLFNRLEGVLPAPVIVAVTAATMMVAAWAVWRFVEPPCRRWIYRLAERAAARVQSSRLGSAKMPEA